MVKKKFNARRYILILITLGLAGTIAGYLMTLNGAAFSAAKIFLVKNPKVIEALGPIRSTRLGLDYSIGYRGGEGSAKIKVVLTGHDKSADAYLTLESIDGAWRVKSGNLIIDGEAPVSLLPETR
jgi:hypothetical protein